jgi:hypothetical protein
MPHHSMRAGRIRARLGSYALLPYGLAYAPVAAVVVAAAAEVLHSFAQVLGQAAEEPLQSVPIPVSEEKERPMARAHMSC